MIKKNVFNDFIKKNTVIEKIIAIVLMFIIALLFSLAATFVETGHNGACAFMIVFGICSVIIWLAFIAENGDKIFTIDYRKGETDYD